MKAKVSRGSGFRGAASYALGDDKNAEFVAGNVTGTTPRELSAEFSAVRQLRPDIARPVWHSSLSLPAGEHLDGDRWQSVVNDYLDGMGFDRDKHQFFAVRHNDTNHDHVHVIASRVGLDGSVWHGKWEARRAIELTQELEQRHGLQRTPGFHQKDSKTLTHNELNKAARTSPEPPRQALQRLVKEAAKGKPTASQFADRLAGAGVEVRANIASTGRMNGFSFGLDGEKFKASQLGKKFTWAALQKQGVSYEQERDRQTLERIAAGTAAQSATANDRRATGRDSSNRVSDGEADRRDQGRDSIRNQSPANRSGPDRESRSSSREGQQGRDEQQSESQGGRKDASPETAPLDYPDGHRRDPRQRPDQLARYLGDLVDRHKVTPEKARQRIDSAVQKDEAPAVDATVFGRSSLKEWYDGLKRRVADAVEVARGYFDRKTHDNAARKGWEGEAMDYAGMSGPRVDQARKQAQKAREARELEQKRQRERETLERAAIDLSNKTGTLYQPDEITKDQGTGEYRPKTAQELENERPRTSLQDEFERLQRERLDDYEHDEPSGPSMG